MNAPKSALNAAQNEGHRVKPLLLFSYSSAYFDYARKRLQRQRQSRRGGKAKLEAGCRILAPTTRGRQAACDTAKSPAIIEDSSSLTNLIGQSKRAPNLLTSRGTQSSVGDDKSLALLGSGYRCK